ncbi:hypothetical protein B0H13DRAFT_2513726 [Mycena leptocephala]|nr:hypothetical protein B0H13DRAFT_2513726 [Mycena leptocephala]
MLSCLGWVILDCKLLVVVLYLDVACGLVECPASDNYVGGVVEEGHGGQDAGHKAVDTRRACASAARKSRCLQQSLQLPQRPFDGIRLYSTTSTTQSKSGLTAVVAGLCGIAIGLGAAQFRPGSDVSAVPNKPVYGTAQEFSQAICELKKIFSTRSGVVSANPDDLQVHSVSTNTYHTGVDHTVVVYPESTEDVVKIVKVANKYKMPITSFADHDVVPQPYSGGTGLEGQFIGVKADSDVVCQPGLDYVELNETLESEGIPFFSPLDPAPEATIGGMLSTGCSGTNAVRYSPVIHPTSDDGSHGRAVVRTQPPLVG